MEVFMNVRGIFRHRNLSTFGKGNTAVFMTGQKNCLQADYKNGRRLLFSQNLMK